MNITSEQEAEILQILESGKRRNNHGKVAPTEKIVFKAFYRYAEMKGFINRTFKIKQFRKDNYHHHPYSDCPLTRGQLLVVLRFGKREGFLFGINPRKNQVWRFTDKKLEDRI